MGILGGILGFGGTVVCCGLLFLVLAIALFVWFWKRQPDQQVSTTPPAPPIQATIEHPTAATTNMPAENPASATPPSPTIPPAPPSADV